jgi:hypothetical protein
MAPIPLSPVDLIFTGTPSYSIEFLFSFNYAISEERLRHALRRACQIFPPVNAELVEDDRFGFRFEPRTTPPELRVVRFSGEGPNLLVPSELAELSEAIHSVPGQPLFRSVLAHTSRGSLLGIHLSHCLVDGYSFFYFLSVLSSCFKDSQWNPRTWLKQRMMRPDLDRRALCPALVDLDHSPHRNEVDVENFFQRTGIPWGPPREAQKLSEVQWDYWHFSNSALSQHYKEASAQTDTRLSKHDVLTALLWKRTAREWPSADDVLSCTNAFDYRRLHSALTPKYFGNAIRCASVVASKQDVLQLPLGLVAEKVRTATASIDEVAAKDSLVCFEEVRRLQGIEAFRHCHVSDPQHGLLVTNLSRVPVHAFDLGGGPPTDFVSLTPAIRSAMVLATTDGLKVRVQGPG